MSRVGRWVPLAAVIAMLAAAMLASAYANPTIPNLPRGAPRTGSPPENVLQREPSLAATSTTSTPRDSAASLPAWLGWVVSALCAAALIAVVAMLLWLLLRDRLAERRAPLTLERTDLPTVADIRRRVRSAVDEGLADLDDTDADPRRAVIACWVRLERAAATAGTVREVGDTSTDLVSRLLASHMVSGDVLAAFAAVYREARFATHTVDVTTREQARSALRQLRDELVAGVASDASVASGRSVST